MLISKCHIFNSAPQRKESPLRERTKFLDLNNEQVSVSEQENSQDEKEELKSFEGGFDTVDEDYFLNFNPKAKSQFQPKKRSMRMNTDSFEGSAAANT